MIAPHIHLDSKDNIYHALFYQLQIKASYTRGDKSQASDYLNPIAIIQRGVIIYLVATRTDDSSHYSHLCFASICQRWDSRQRRKTPDNFQLDTYLDAGGMGFSPIIYELPNHGKNTTIEPQFTKQAGKSLTESKLGDDQIVTLNDDDTWPFKQPLIWPHSWSGGCAVLVVG